MSPVPCGDGNGIGDLISFAQEDLSVADLKVDASIAVIDGGFYQVRLKSVPHAGELIDLYSLLDVENKRVGRHYFEVVQVVHKMYDVTKRRPNGMHFVTIHMKRTACKWFEQ
jgi:hypothetical protein